MAILILKGLHLGFFRTCLVAIIRCDAAAGQPGEREHFSCLGITCNTPGQAGYQSPSQVPTMAMVRSPGSSLEYLRYSQEYLNHATFAPPRGGRPDGAGWFPRRVRTDGRVNLSGRGVRERYESCTFEQWMLFKEHSLHTSDTMRQRPRDGRSGLPSTMLDDVSVTEQSPM